MSKTLSGSELNDLVAGLHKLSRNLWWTWDQDAQDLFKQLSPRAWQNLYHNAVAVLREVSDYELRVHLQEVQFGKNARAVLTDFEKYLADKETWGHKHAAHLRKNPVAYFSAEFGFHESLPISAGGLGILAGDHAKSASDLGLGFVGISLFYREGYFQQAIDMNNWQTEYYNLIDPANVPLEPVLNPEGERLICNVEIGMSNVAFQAWRINVGRVPVYLLDANNWQTEYYTLLNPKNLPLEPVVNAKGEQIVCSVDIAMNQVFFQAWRVNVGRVPVYLLDTNLPQNEQHFRDLTLRVYGGDSTTRIMQEMLLGIGGVKLLRKLGIQPSTFHMNEGHAAFLTLELIREKIAAGKNFAQAAAETKAECLFTTHTPVEAGHDRFSPDLLNYSMQ
ncbi:MAG TPA: alpha-glucan family phosphorylase, partial [Candidatus Baltobacteraceae bacterium]|nr:alpha-glucan family phosphorylase [Candidatus Baltobacteraceae bacterium]